MFSLISESLLSEHRSRVSDVHHFDCLECLPQTAYVRAPVNFKRYPSKLNSACFPSSNAQFKCGLRPLIDPASNSQGDLARSTDCDQLIGEPICFHASSCEPSVRTSSFCEISILPKNCSDQRQDDPT